MPFDATNYTPTDSVLKCLEDARQWLSEPGRWAQENICDADDRGCSINWLGRLAPTRTVFHAAANLLERHVPARRGYGCPVVDFNDDPTTTHADILALFDRAIAARRAELLAEQTA